MRGGVVVLNDKGYQEWLQQQQTFAELSQPRRAAADAAPAERLADAGKTAR